MSTRSVLAGLICMATASVSACTKPYEPPEIRGTMSFAGAADVGQETGRVRVIMTHGMCSQYHQATGIGARNWVGERSEIVAKLVEDTSYVRQEGYSAAKNYFFGDSRTPVVSRYDVDIRGADGVTYELRMLKWGQSFYTATNTLDSLNNEINSPRITRASLNEELKTDLMDDCLVDAVAYSGARGNSLRAAYREAMCELMGGAISGANAGVPGEKVTCRGARSSRGIPTVLVPESLGAKIMMDATVAINGVNTSEALGPIRAIHLATNQIPLLSQAEASEAGKQEAILSEDKDLIDGALAFQGFLRQLSGSGPTRFASQPLNVVVYSDPNDLVGYPLSKSWIPEVKGITLTNVLISNANTIGGFVADPLEAHRGAARPGVFELILYGHDAGS